jgi:hypothetical protein
VNGVVQMGVRVLPKQHPVPPVHLLQANLSVAM